MDLVTRVVDSITATRETCSDITTIISSHQKSTNSLLHKCTARPEIYRHIASTNMSTTFLAVDHKVMQGLRPSSLFVSWITRSSTNSGSYQQDTQSTRYAATYASVSTVWHPSICLRRNGTLKARRRGYCSWVINRGHDYETLANKRQIRLETLGQNGLLCDYYFFKEVSTFLNLGVNSQTRLRRVDDDEIHIGVCAPQQ
ncbi:hypothetical protein V1508DRAFT_394261 [Lipomyces doorenjongii]|uniref:uncharacterized protein n=1 Tax=Lipomyces doorenjongii TaxID=383834 RepID=UPI0034CE1B80